MLRTLNDCLYLIAYPVFVVGALAISGDILQVILSDSDIEQWYIALLVLLTCLLILWFLALYRITRLLMKCVNRLVSIIWERIANYRERTLLIRHVEDSRRSSYNR